MERSDFPVPDDGFLTTHLVVTTGDVVPGGMGLLVR
jgi:hypothetical protein